jgi:hypothetical protein
MVTASNGRSRTPAADRSASAMGAFGLCIGVHVCDIPASRGSRTSTRKISLNEKDASQPR